MCDACFLMFVLPVPNVFCNIWCDTGVMTVMFKLSYLKYPQNIVNWCWQKRDRWVYLL